MGWRLSLAALTFALVAAGCVSPTPAAVVPEDGATASDGQTASWVPNTWLLDAPRPFNARVSGGAEPSILVDQAGQWIWIGDTSGLWRSANGGATWTRSSNPFLPGVFGDGWALAQDATGALYASTTQGQVIGLAVSRDGGATWSAQYPVVHAGTIADRPWVAARGDGEVVVIQNGDLGEDCAYSNDGGMTFLRRALVNAGPTNAGNVVFDSKGRLLYAVHGSVHRWQTACQGAALPMTLPPSGAQIFAQVAVDDADRIYVAQPSPNNGRMELRGFTRMQASSLKTVVVSPPALKVNTFGTLSTHGDEIAVAWYGGETPGSITEPGYNGAWNVYVARVTGFWTGAPSVTWTRITTEPNHVGDFCMGGIGCTTGSGDRDLLDYFMIDHDAQGNLHVAFGHDGTSTASEVRYAFLPGLT